MKPAEQFRPSVSVFRPEISTSSPAWSEWTLSTPCSVTCGRGFIEMRRHCVQPGRCAGKIFKTLKILFLKAYHMQEYARVSLFD